MNISTVLNWTSAFLTATGNLCSRLISDIDRRIFRVASTALAVPGNGIAQMPVSNLLYVETSADGDVTYTEERDPNYTGVGESVLARFTSSSSEQFITFNPRIPYDRSLAIEALARKEWPLKFLESIRVHGPINSYFLNTTVHNLCYGSHTELFISTESTKFLNALITLYDYRPDIATMKALLEVAFSAGPYQALLRDRITDAERDEILFEATQHEYPPETLIAVIESGTTSQEGRTLALSNAAIRGNLAHVQTMILYCSWDQASLQKALDEAETKGTPGPELNNVIEFLYNEIYPSGGMK